MVPTTMCSLASHVVTTTITTTSQLGDTPLYWALRNKHVPAVRMLIRRGAEIETKDMVPAGRLAPLHNATGWHLPSTHITAISLEQHHCMEVVSQVLQTAC